MVTGYPWPSCKVHHKLTTMYNTFYSWTWHSLYDPHGPVHVWLGGVMDCDATYARIKNLVGPEIAQDLATISFVHRKNAFRNGVFKCTGSAQITDAPDKVNGWTEILSMASDDTRQAPERQKTRASVSEIVASWWWHKPIWLHVLTRLHYCSAAIVTGAATRSAQVFKLPAVAVSVVCIAATRRVAIALVGRTCCLGYYPQATERRMRQTTARRSSCPPMRLTQLLLGGTCGCLEYDLQNGDDWKEIMSKMIFLGDLLKGFDDVVKKKVVATLCQGVVNEGDHLQVDTVVCTSKVVPIRGGCLAYGAGTRSTSVYRRSTWQRGPTTSAVCVDCSVGC